MNVLDAGFLEFRGQQLRKFPLLLRGGNNGGGGVTLTGYCAVA